jgi:GNAT superfamily N-acetyltransferase
VGISRNHLIFSMVRDERKPEVDSVVYQNTLPSTDAFCTLFDSTGWNSEYRLDKQQLCEAIRHSWHVVAAYSDGVLVGFGRVISDGILHALIVDVIVLPEYQLKGIGRAIMDRLVNECRSRNIRDIQLFCAKGKTVFYEKLGFNRRPDDAPGMEIKLG